MVHARVGKNGDAVLHEYFLHRGNDPVWRLSLLRTACLCVYYIVVVIAFVIDKNKQKRHFLLKPLGGGTRRPVLLYVDAATTSNPINT